MQVTSTKLVCDYCGNVSPVVAEQEVPSGWMREWTEIPVYGSERHEFCCSAHQERFWKERENAT